VSKVAVILSGCGYLDGAEIHESTLCLLALAQAGHKYHCFAPDIPQALVVNHITQQPMEESRNSLIESARIARGKISPLENLSVAEYDAILLPGGFGVATTLSDFAEQGAECTVLESLKKIILEFHASEKPIGATCITPAILAKIFEGVSCIKLTLGTEKDSADLLEKLGMHPEIATASDCAFDDANKVFTTPCYMEPDDLPAMFKSIQRIVSRL
jgi:enhancing lycopene biosynthesis protein 2